MTNDLKSRLDAMVREADKNVYGHAEDCRLRECGDSCSCGLVEQNIALDLLQRIEEMEATLRTLRGGIFADANAVNAFIDAALKGGQP